MPVSRDGTLVVYQDEHVVVSAILVDHVCYPAFGFRFDSKYGSIVISGIPPIHQCIRLAQGGYSFT